MPTRLAILNLETATSPKSIKMILKTDLSSLLARRVTLCTTKTTRKTMITEEQHKVHLPAKQAAK